MSVAEFHDDGFAAVSGRSGVHPDMPAGVIIGGPLVQAKLIDPNLKS